MSLFDPTPSPAEELAADQIKFALHDLTHKAIDSIKEIQTQLWLTDTPTQDVLDEFATNAEKILNARDAAVAFLSAIATETGQTLTDLIAPGWYQPAEGKDLQVNEDGSVTVIDV